jgi:regulator of nucleoside diphosphate kinase
MGYLSEESSMKTHQVLPPITVCTYDYNRLMLTAFVTEQTHKSQAAFLLSELRRATLCRADELPDDIVSTNCRVLYRIDGGDKVHAQLLVHPEDLKWPGPEICVTTPLGTALLGLRVGDEMHYRAGDGSQEHRVLVEGVGLRFLDDGLSWRDLSVADAETCHEPAQSSRKLDG